MARGNFGERLKREREMREVSLDEISAATRIGIRFLEALENEDWNKLPGGIFNRGFVRAAARYLGLDEESLLAEYDLARGQQVVPPLSLPTAHPASELTARLIPALVVVLTLLVLTFGGYFGWHRLRALHDARESSPAATAPAPLPSEPVIPASSTASIPLQLSVFSSETVHVSVIADGQNLFDGDLSAGQTLRFDARNEFIVSAANSSAVLLELNGQTMPPLGAPGASGKMVLTQKDLNRGPDGSAQP